MVTSRVACCEGKSKVSADKIGQANTRCARRMWVAEPYLLPLRMAL
jgi:hypothetical protein